MKSEPKSEAVQKREPTDVKPTLQSALEQIAPKGPSLSQQVEQSESLFSTKAKPSGSASLSDLLLATDTQEKREMKHESAPLESNTPKVESVATVQKESLSIKINEAKQMIRHVSTELKEALENYKPPFTRVKMTLHPAKLGEMDVMLVQRGNNVHININSNSSAIQILAHNVNELKTQLANNGVVNTTMHFGTAHGEQQQKEQQHRQRQFQSYRDLEELSAEELELVSSIEIVVPRYV